MRTAIVFAFLLIGCTSSPDGGNPGATALHVPEGAGRFDLDTLPAADEWQGALRLEGSFDVPSMHSAGGSYPFTLLMASQDDALFFWLEIRAIAPNWDEQEGRLGVLSDTLEIYLDVGNERLESPADRLRGVNGWHFGSSFEDDYWDGRRWNPQSPFDHAEPEQNGSRGRWIAMSSDADQGTLRWEGKIPFHSPLVQDGFQVEADDSFHMLLALHRSVKSDSSKSAYVDVRGTYPAAPFGSDQLLDPVGWLKVAR